MIAIVNKMWRWGYDLHHSIRTCSASVFELNDSQLCTNFVKWKGVDYQKVGNFVAAVALGLGLEAR